MIQRLDVLDVENQPARVVINAMVHAKGIDDVALVVAALRAMDYLEEDPMLYIEMLESHLVSRSVRAQILGYRDSARLRRWLERALEVDDAAALVRDP